MTASSSLVMQQPYVSSSGENHAHHTSWKSCDISHTRQEFDCISHLCLSERKKSRSSGVCVSAWTIQFMKHVLPRFINPRKPVGQWGEKKKWWEPIEKTWHNTYYRQKWKCESQLRQFRGEQHFCCVLAVHLHHNGICIFRKLNSTKMGSRE